MMRLIIFFFLVFICEQGSATIYQCNTNTSCGCSTSLTLISRIIGGESAVRQSWSWAVSIRTSGEHRCGGTILSPSFIITAAHCFEYITDLKSVTILAGSLTLKPSSNNSSQVRSIAKLYRHPRFDPSSNRNDVALLRLSSPFNMRHGNIKSICLPSGTVSQPPDNINMIAIGWGITSISSDKSSSTLRQVTLKSVSLTYSGCKPLIFDSKLQFCAGIITGGKDTCLGDSGGPLMAFVNNIWQLHGITSYGNGCALPEYPGVYTRISYYVKWIKSIMASNKVTTTMSTTSRRPSAPTTIIRIRPTTTRTIASRTPKTTKTTTRNRLS